MTEASQFTRNGQAILAVTSPADQAGVTICLSAGHAALAHGDHETAGAMLDEAAARAGIIGYRKLAQLHHERLTGNRS